MSDTTNLVAVATDENTGDLGRQVFWDQYGHTNHTKCVLKLDEYGIPEEFHPAPPEPGEACVRAISDVVPKKRGRGGGIIDVTKIKTTKEDKTGETVYLIHKKRKNLKEETVLFDEDLKVRLTQVGTVYCEPSDHPVAYLLQERFEYHQEHLNTNDMSALFTSVVNACMGTRIRARGGMYFIAKENLPLWNSLVEAVESVSNHTFHAIPMDNLECVRNVVLSGFTSQAESEIAKIEAAMEKNLRKRGLETQLKACAGVQRQMEHYKDLLGVTLEDLTEKVEDLQANVSMLALAAGGSDEDEEDF